MVVESSPTAPERRGAPIANVNTWHAIGRLTADPVTKDLPGGSKVTTMRFVVNNRRFNSQKNDWEDDPCFIDLELFDRKDGKSRPSDQVRQLNLRKGSSIYVTGSLWLDQWEDKNGGGKRSKHKVIVDRFQALDAKGAGPDGDRVPDRRPATPPAARPQPARHPAGTGDDDGDGYGSDDDQIPF